MSTLRVLSHSTPFTSLYQAFYGVGEHRYFLNVAKLLDGADFAARGCLPCWVGLAMLGVLDSSLGGVDQSSKAWRPDEWPPRRPAVASDGLGHGAGRPVGYNGRRFPRGRRAGPFARHPGR